MKRYGLYMTQNLMKYIFSLIIKVHKRMTVWDI